MADYPILAPTLAALQGVKDLPQGTEDPAKLDDVDRQTRNWIYDFLSIYIDTNTGKIKSSAFGIGTSFPAGVIRGTNPVDSSQREIAQGTVGTLDLADLADTWVDNSVFDPKTRTWLKDMFRKLQTATINKQVLD